MVKKYFKIKAASLRPKDTISFACGCLDTLELLFNFFLVQMKKKVVCNCDLSDRVSVKSLSFMAILRGHANNVVRIQDKTTETKV